LPGASYMEFFWSEKGSSTSIMASQVKLNNIVYYICFSFDTYCHLYFMIFSIMHTCTVVYESWSLTHEKDYRLWVPDKLCGTGVDLKETCGKVTSENYIMRNSVICAMHLMFFMWKKIIIVLNYAPYHEGVCGSGG
jgi:hypothetical protein